VQPVTEGQAIALVGVIFAALYAIVQIGDRFWKPANDKPDSQQSARCGFQHDQMQETMRRLTDGQTAMMTAVSAMVQNMEAAERIAHARHEEMMRTLADRNRRNSEVR
jgi:hypothetical protein